MLNDFSNASNVGGASGAVGVNNPKTKVSLEKGMHHYPVTKLEDLERENSSGEENERKREKG